MLDTALKDTVEGRLINFEKRRREFEVLTQIRLLQSAAGLYQIKYDKHFMKWFYNIRIYDDSEGYDHSVISLGLYIDADHSIIANTREISL